MTRGLRALPCALLAAVVPVLLLAACAGGSARPAGGPSRGGDTGPATSGVPTAPSTSTATSPPPAASPTASADAPPPDRAQQVLAGLTPAQRVGQLLMIGTPASGSPGAATAAITGQAVGNVFLSGRSSAGVAATAALTAGLQAAARTVPLLVATDQEGGEVQVLSGPGFDRMPTGVGQSALPPADLLSAFTRWGAELAAAGVRVDLGPVLDVVPPGVPGDANPPVAGFDRELGHDPATVSAHGVAVVAGLRAAGVAATGKHFPGLGRVDANTDTDAGVTDSVTAVDDPYLAPFADAVRAGIALVMVSNAVYTRIDPTQPAVFSPAVVTDLLRGRLGFRGVVVSDDLGAAAAVADVPVGERAVRFVAAGGDVVLDVSPGHAPALAAALLDRAGADPAFAARVDAAALRVLELKVALGLLH